MTIQENMLGSSRLCSEIGKKYTRLATQGPINKATTKPRFTLDAKRLSIAHIALAYPFSVLVDTLLTLMFLQLINTSIANFQKHRPWDSEPVNLDQCFTTYVDILRPF